MLASFTRTLIDPFNLGLFFFACWLGYYRAPRGYLYLAAGGWLLLMALLVNAGRAALDLSPLSASVVVINAAAYWLVTWLGYRLGRWVEKTIG